MEQFFLATQASRYIPFFKDQRSREVNLRNSRDSAYRPSRVTGSTLVLPWSPHSGDVQHGVQHDMPRPHSWQKEAMASASSRAQRSRPSSRRRPSGDGRHHRCQRFYLLYIFYLALSIHREYSFNHEEPWTGRAVGQSGQISWFTHCTNSTFRYE